MQNKNALNAFIAGRIFPGFADELRSTPLPASVLRGYAQSILSRHRDELIEGGRFDELDELDIAGMLADTIKIDDAFVAELLDAIEPKPAPEPFTAANLSGTARFIGLTNWLSEGMAGKLKAAETGEETVKVADVSGYCAAVVVTVYEDDPSYFEVHPVCQTASRVLDGISAADDEGRDMASALYKAIAAVIGAPSGWHAKSPSGSSWVQAMQYNGRANMAL